MNPELQAKCRGNNTPGGCAPAGAPEDLLKPAVNPTPGYYWLAKAHPNSFFIHTQPRYPQ